ncbi:STAS domain-containing protein (plasmid) [Deinococcus sp. KNUC1210]|uniref:STAS domain-containing protein n=1 Tax=Deinococcus sp. KNUC1210 TaxID=2917691 RepID=UPI001EEF8256|nr:STAS domain-containing protein [Deinococcus sp. KNUC1210]ULH17775.1 STAS domain-containing protein [Deinococcus sp. KNUC1210]
MAFDATLETTPDAAIITLSGELDASAAPKFRTAIEQAAESSPARLVLMMQNLDYMASAGLRALVFAKQKMGSSVELYVIGAQEAVAETIELTGFQHSVTMQSEYQPV